MIKGLHCFCTGDSKLADLGSVVFVFFLRVNVVVKITMGASFSKALKHQGESVTNEMLE